MQKITIMSYYILSNFANRKGLDIAESTTSPAGYPTALRYCLFGLDNLSQAELYAEQLQHDLDLIGEHVTVAIRYFRKRDGWHLWQRQGLAYSMYELTAELYDYQIPYYKRDAEDWLAERAENLLDKYYLEEKGVDINTYNNNTQKVYDAILSLNDGEFLIIDQYTIDGYFEIVQEQAMGYREDVWMHEIGISIE